MDAETTLRALAAATPRSWSELSALTGPLDADVDGADWFHVYRHGLAGALASVSVEFDPFRGPGPDPALARYLLVVRAPLERAQAALDGAPGFAVDADDDGVLVRWERRAAAPAPAAVYDPAVRAAFLAALPGALAGAGTAPELEAASAPPPAAGIARGAQPHQVRTADGMQLVPARAPSVTLSLSPPAGARELATLWGIERPVAVSSDVHQASWWLQSGGEVVADAYRRRIATSELRPGLWHVRIRLDGRPAGPLPGVVAGASPAYDVLDRGGDVVALVIEATAVATAPPPESAGSM
jgi:hypothetical protein